MIWPNLRNIGTWLSKMPDQASKQQHCDFIVICVLVKQLHCALLHLFLTGARGWVGDFSMMGYYVTDQAEQNRCLQYFRQSLKLSAHMHV